MNTEWKIGDKIQNRWEVHKVLRGGMGVVYLVYDHQAHEAFAVKTVREEILQSFPGASERFRQECIVWISLDLHPNVVQACFVEFVNGKPLLFLAYVTGGDLSKWIGTPRLLKDLPLVLRLGIQFCDGMIHANSKGIKVHRDIKPQNCLLTEDGTLKVTDFGLAKAFDVETEKIAESNTVAAPSGGLLGRIRRAFAPEVKREKQDQGGNNPASLTVNATRTGAAAGTPLYMSPEQFDDVKHVDVRADIYSFGIMLFEMVTGRVPFAGKDWEELERLHKGKNAPYIGVNVPDLDTLVRACLAKNPAARIATFAEVRQVLLEILNKLTGESLPQLPSAAELNIVQQVHKGVSLQYLGQHAQAIASFDEVLKIHPANPMGWACKAASLVALKRYEEAIACFERALELQPNPSFWTAKGDALLELGKIEAAFSDYDRALQLDQYCQSAWTAKGLLLDRLTRHEEALLCHTRALGLDETKATSWHNKGLVLAKLKRFAESITCNDRALELDPNFAQAWFIKGAALVNGFRRIPEAAACFEKAANLGYGPAAAALDQLGVQVKRVEKPVAAEKTHQHDLASTITLQLPTNPSMNQVAQQAETRTDPAQAAFENGISLVNQGNHNEGLVWFEEAKRLGHPNAQKALIEARLILDVVSFSQAGERDQALAKLDAAQRLDSPPRPELIAQLRQTVEQVPKGKFLQPQDKSGWNDMGATLVEVGKLWEAAACFKKAIDLDPGYESAWLNLGLAFAKFKEYTHALTAFDRLLSIKPDSDQAWYLKGMVLGNLQKQNEAITSYDRALQLNPRLAEAWYNKSLALMWLKHYEEAIKSCDRTLELSPRHLQALLNKAKALYPLGREKEALGCVAQMKLIDPDRANELLKT